jgi:spore coat protein CotH
MYSLFILSLGMFIGSSIIRYITPIQIQSKEDKATTTEYTINIAKACALMYANRNK